MKIITSFLQLLPAILGAILAVESSLQVSGAGASKKDIILAAIQAAAAAGENVDNKLVAGISVLIDTVVGIFNKTGAFKNASA